MLESFYVVALRAVAHVDARHPYHFHPAELLVAAAILAAGALLYALAPGLFKVDDGEEERKP